jgi:hypothetical protein
MASYTAVAIAQFAVDPTDPQYVICSIPLADLPVSGTVFSITTSNVVTQPTPVTPPLAAANSTSNSVSDVGPGVTQSLNFISRTQTTITVTAATDSQQTATGNSQGVQQTAFTTPAPSARSRTGDLEGNMTLEEQALWFQYGDEGPGFYVEPTAPANKPEGKKPEAPKPNDEQETSADMVGFEVEPVARPWTEQGQMDVVAEPNVWTTLPGQAFYEASMLPAVTDDANPDKSLPTAALAPVLLLGAGLSASVHRPSEKKASTWWPRWRGKMCRCGS